MENEFKVTTTTNTQSGDEMSFRELPDGNVIIELTDTETGETTIHSPSAVQEIIVR